MARAVDAGVAQMLGEDSIDVREAGRSINERGIAVRSDLDVTVHETVGASVWGYKSPVGQLPTREVREGAALASANGWTNPLRPGLKASLAAANEGVGLLFRPSGRRETAPQ